MVELNEWLDFTVQQLLDRDDQEHTSSATRWAQTSIPSHVCTPFIDLGRYTTVSKLFFGVSLLVCMLCFSAPLASLSEMVDASGSASASSSDLTACKLCTSPYRPCSKTVRWVACILCLSVSMNNNKRGSKIQQGEIKECVDGRRPCRCGWWRK